MTTNLHQQRRYRSGNLIRTARPWHWDEFWNAASSKSIQRLAREQAGLSFPLISLYIGEAGSGKTSAAKVCGMMTNCEQVAIDIATGVLLPGRVPCGMCHGCLAVQLGGGWERGAYFELDAANQSRIASELEEALERSRSCKSFGHQVIPAVIAIDEAGKLPETVHRRLQKLIEESEHVQFILIMNSDEMRTLTPSMVDRIAHRRYRFEVPNRSEVVAGLIRVAKVLGIRLEEPAAERLASQARHRPRASLDALEQARTLGSYITLDGVKQIFSTPGVNETNVSDDEDVDRFEDE